MDPDGVFTAELYTGENVNAVVSGEGFYYVQYQIADFQ